MSLHEAGHLEVFGLDRMEAAKNDSHPMNPSKLILAGVLPIVVALVISKTQAAPTVFVLDDSQSQVTLSGTVAGTAFTAQGPGSLTTHYNGHINADISGSTIQFPGGSVLNALTNGVWQPAVGGSVGTGPADYGAVASVNLGIFSANVYGAARNIVLDLASPMLSVTGGSFDGSSLVFGFATNTATLDYNYGSGSTIALTGYSTNTVANGATLSTNNGVLKLAIQIDTQFTFSLLSSDDSTLHLTGQLVATNATAVAAAPVFQSVAVSNQSLVMTVQNATAQSQLMVSTNLTNWMPATGTTTTNSSGSVIFTAPMSGPKGFFRVQQ